MALRDGRMKQEASDWALQSQTASWGETGEISSSLKPWPQPPRSPDSAMPHAEAGAETLL